MTMMYLLSELLSKDSRIFIDFGYLICCVSAVVFLLLSITLSCKSDADGGEKDDMHTVQSKEFRYNGYSEEV